MPKKPQERGRKVEKKFAAKVGGQEQLASGSLPGSKGDVISEDVLYEHKLTTKAQYVLKLSLLQKIEREALAKARTPVFAIDFEHRGQYAVLRLDDYLALIQACEDH